MHWFAIASLTPAFFMFIAALLGGWWAVWALLSVTGFVIAADRLSLVTLGVREDDHAVEFGHKLTVVLGVVHLILIPLGVWALTSNPRLSVGASVCLALAMGVWFGQVSNSNAHELIHSSGRRDHRLGIAVYVSLLFGHHASAHPLVHHVHVATDLDPNSPKVGEGFYQFWPRAWIGSFIAGFRAENARRARKSTAAPLYTHPYVTYCGGALLVWALAWIIAGWAGVLVWTALGLYASMQLMLSDYVQHYGLRRTQHPDGSWEPAGPQHSWNSSQWYSSAMMLNAPRHSDHHVSPMRPFPSLRLDRETMPVLPRPLPVMGAIALVPPAWHQIMDHRAAKWRKRGGE